MSTNKNPHAVTLGRLGGKKKSDAKAAAVRENGKKGGRPRKSAQEREDEATDRMMKRVKKQSKAVKLTNSIL
jgi:hypothetical protein